MNTNKYTQLLADSSQLTPGTLRSLEDLGTFTQSDFEKRFHLKQTKTHFCLNKIFGRRCRYSSPTASRKSSPHDCNGRFGVDHRYMFKTRDDPKGAVSVLVWFPYPQGDRGDRKNTRKLLEWANANGFYAIKLPPNTGWYGHGTSMVVVWRPWSLDKRHHYEQVPR